MNDFWNDPPECPDPPRCPQCLEYAGDEAPGESAPEMVRLVCQECGHGWELPLDCGPEPDPPADLEAWPPDENTCRTCGAKTDCVYCSEACAPACLHGNRPGDCGACDHAADLAFDAAREARHFGR